MKKTHIGRVAFPGKHRLVFEGLLEYNQEGFPKDVVFAEIHENNRAENIIRMQIDIFGMHRFCRGIEEIVPLGESLLLSKEPASQKVQGSLRIYTRSKNAQTTLFFGAKILTSDRGKKHLWYYINMYRNGATYALKFNKPEILALSDHVKIFTQHLQVKYMEAQAQAKAAPSSGVEVIYE